MISLFTGMGMLMLFSGCAMTQTSTTAQVKKEPKVIVQKVDREDIKQILQEEKFIYLNNNPDRVFAVNGEGIAPQNTVSPAQAMALAKRAAIADAYRQMAEKLYGVQINAKDTIKNAALYDSRIVSQVNGLVKDATITEHDFKDGLFIVRMELKMNGARWKEIFAY
ncbi:lipoprotein required for motility [Sulfurospirillum arcachonense]|uniref:LPP20 family lipoprotein n=1 Tax=Sulfurospirillum arcachonense TaxID=57666 RepID=UPI0012EBF225